LQSSVARFAHRILEIYAHLSCSLRSPHQVDSTPFSGVSFPIGSQFLAQDPVPRQGFSQSCTPSHFFAHFGT
jgi:hypothetical protein